MPRKITQAEYDFLVHVNNSPIRPAEVKPKDRIEITESGEEIMRQVIAQVESLKKLEERRKTMKNQ